MSKKTIKVPKSQQFLYYSQLALNNFKWYNLPENIEPYYIERALFYDGASCFTFDDVQGYIALPAQASQDLNIYHEPTTYNLRGHNFYKTVNIDNAVYIKNNLYAEPLAPLILEMTERENNVQEIIDMNIMRYKTPIIFSTTNKTILQNKMILEKIKKGELAIFLDSDFSVDTLKTFDITGEYIIDKLQLYKKQLKYEILTILGYSNAETEKKERMIVDEVNINNEFTDNGYLLLMYNARQQAVDKINKMFNLDIKIEVNRDRIKPDFYYEERGAENEI